jgi:hypothetical protein
LQDLVKLNPFDFLQGFRWIAFHSGHWTKALSHCLDHPLDQESAREIKSQVWRFGRDVHKCFSGVVGAIDKFLSPIVNAYAPDIIFDDVLEKNQLVYVQLPRAGYKPHPQNAVISD